MTRVFVVLGLGFGDEGKGGIVDWLVRREATAGAPPLPPPLIVRWNGGPQAAHHVVTDDGRTHCFAQLGSGSFVDGVRTHLGPAMAIDAYALVREAEAIAGAGVPEVLRRVSIDPRAVVVTPWHGILGRLREVLRGGGAHGSTGRGVAEAVLGAEAGRPTLRAGDGAGGLAEVRAWLRGEAAALVDGSNSPGAHELAARFEDDTDLWDATAGAIAALPAAGVTFDTAPPRAETVVLEGAQGALLDRDHGFFPHVTPSRITRAAAEREMAAMGLSGPPEVWGVLRAYHTRHGAGPLPTEDAELTRLLPETHNHGLGWAGAFRVGRFDTALARRALDFAGPIDRLAITCLDRIAALAPGEPIVEMLEERLGRRVDLESWGPTAAGKQER